MTEPKPCPFCGRVPFVLNGHVKCVSFGCPAQHSATVGKWNKRYDDMKPLKENYKVIAVNANDRVIKCQLCGLTAKKINEPPLDV